MTNFDFITLGTSALLPQSLINPTTFSCDNQIPTFKSQIVIAPYVHLVFMRPMKIGM